MSSTFCAPGPDHSKVVVKVLDGGVNPPAVTALVVVPNAPEEL